MEDGEGALGSVLFDVVFGGLTREALGAVVVELFVGLVTEVDDGLGEFWCFE